MTQYLITTRGFGSGSSIDLIAKRGFTSANIWAPINTGETTWDAGWDLDENVYTTVWDPNDTVYADATTNTSVWDNA